MRVDAVRRFNRFYTARIGALRAGLLGSRFPLPQARLIYELGQRGECAATELADALDLDAGYLSRLLAHLPRPGLAQARRSTDDARRVVLALSEKGRTAYAQLDARSREETAAMLAGLPQAEQARLVHAMHTIEGLLARKAARKQELVL